ncbi:RAP protein, putative [Plasmodium chabaudi adami]|uniref:RAP protein, putative n=1 Tax=Plasmodium chabaudi adami TaxID=5826 RepID=A0A1D3S2X0_PLACE|nr:RAP protein, putative [Plasmodium chabaudi adami]
MCICISNYAINITKISKAFLNGKKYIRTGKFNDLVCKKKVLSESIENKLNEVNKKDVNQVKILKLFSIDEIKSGIPRRHTKRQKGVAPYNRENGENSENRENRESSPLSNINNPADDCANVTNVWGYKNKILLKKNNTQNSVKRSNFIEDQNGSNITNECNSIDSKKKSNKKSYNQCVIPNKLFRKKYICIENNIKLVDSYINKKYHIEVKKRDNNKNGKTNNDGNYNNVFNYSEERSIQLLDEIKERENFQNKDQHNDKKKNNNNNELQISSVDYENKNRIIKKIYKASINHVRDENLWKKYVQNVFTISAYLDASEIVILFWCFSKIGYRDNRLINLLSSIILKKINELSCCALSLLLNSYKKLEIKKYDTIELLTNQFCFHVSSWKFQDIALVANSLAFFYIYHKNFWKKCILKLQQNYSFTHPLHLCLVISSFARLEIREGTILLCLCRSTKKLANNFSPNNLALVIHSFAKLKFNHPKFYNYLYQFVHKYLDKQLLGKQQKEGVKNGEENGEKDGNCENFENDETTVDSYIDEYPKLNKQNKLFDLQSLVLLLFSCTCLISCTEQMILKLTYLIIPNKDFLGNHKIDKLKYVSDYLQYFFPSTFEKFPEEIKNFYYYIDRYEIKNKKKLKYSARWITEVSRILTKINVNHLRNVYINNICADIMLPDSNIIIMCLGPYSYYVNSLLTTSISDLKKNILEKKKYNVITLNYHDWNKLNDYEEQINFLYSFGRNAANYLFLNTTKEIDRAEHAENGENGDNSESWKPEDGVKSDTYELCQEQENENNFSDEDNEIIDFIKNGICVNEEKENINSYDIDDIKKFLNNTPKNEK